MHEERTRVVAAVAAGRSYREAARESGVSAPTAMRWFQAENKAVRELIADAVQAVKDGHPIELVARAARVSHETLWLWLRAALNSRR